jgi:hypothetical protein
LINCFSIPSGIFIEVFCLELNHSFSALNIYGLYEGKKFSWSKLFGLQCLRLDELIIGGDLNFTVSEEIWGYVAREDKLASFFTDQIERHSWIDVEPILL